MKLVEGMRPGDLQDLILPMLTVDEYVSKVDDDAIVVGFYVHDKDAAEDLNRFIQKSSLQLLDTDISPAPDQHGYYLVFVEFMNNEQLENNIKFLIEEVNALVDDYKWQMSVRGIDEIVAFSPKLLGKKFAKMRQNKTNKVMELLTNSDLTDLIIEENHIILKNNSTKFQAKFIAIDNEPNLLKMHNLTESAVKFDFNDISENLKITSLLGKQWASDKIGDYTLLKTSDSDLTILLSNAHFI